MRFRYNNIEKEKKNKHKTIKCPTTTRSLTHTFTMPIYRCNYWTIAAKSILYFSAICRASCNCTSNCWKNSDQYAQLFFIVRVNSHRCKYLMLTHKAKLLFSKCCKLNYSDSSEEWLIIISSVCPSVCLAVNRITRKVLKWFLWNLRRHMDYCYEKNQLIFGVDSTQHDRTASNFAFRYCIFRITHFHPPLPNGATDVGVSGVIVLDVPLSISSSS